MIKGTVLRHCIKRKINLYNRKTEDSLKLKKIKKKHLIFTLFILVFIYQFNLFE